MDPDQERAGLAWQMGVWNRIADIYLREINHHACPTQWYLADQGVGTVLGFCPHHEWCARWDIMPAKALNWRQVWVNRRNQTGDDQYQPYTEIHDFRDVVTVVGS